MTMDKSSDNYASDGGILTPFREIFESETLTHLYHAGGADPSSLSEEELIRYRLMLHNAI